MSTKPVLDDKIVEILTSIQSALSATGDYASKQLPDIANQYIAYNRVSLTLGYVICIVFIISVVTFAYKNKNHFDNDDATIIFSGFGLIPVLWVLFNFNNLIMVWFARLNSIWCMRLKIFLLTERKPDSFNIMTTKPILTKDERKQVSYFRLHIQMDFVNGLSTILMES